jgi:ATP-binding cassette, subfamily B, bacterial MsbA
LPEHPDPLHSPATASYASRELMSRLWHGYVRRHAWTLVLATFVMVIEGSTLGALSYLLEPLFDRVFGPGGNASALIWVGGAILGLFLIRAVTSVISKALIAGVTQKSAATMQGDLLRHILTLDGNFFHRNPPGALIERVQGDPMIAQNAWSSVLMGASRDVVALISLLAVAISIDLRWTLAALIGAPLLIVPALMLQRYLRRKAMMLRDQVGHRTTRLDEIFHGIQAVKLNQMEDYQASRFDKVTARITRAEVRAAVARASTPALIDVVTGIGFFAVLMLGGREVAEGERTVGEFMSFFTAMALTFQPLRRLGDLAGQWQIAAASLERVFGLMDTKAQSRRPAVSTSLPAPGAPEIIFDNVSFAYDDQPVLHGLSFTARAGAMTALVGASGAGKSTVFHLLTALLEPDAGQIRIGGIDCAQMSLSDQRRKVASVSQDTALFDEALRENVTLGQDAVPADRLQHALDDALVSEFLPRFPGGLDAPAGPRGSGLSGGQRQRVALARALLQDAPILLLDEATSALDAVSEALVTTALRRASAGRTTLVVAHRLATVREADHIVVLDKGQVVEQGNHDLLLAQNGVYAGLYRLQFRA